MKGLFLKRHVALLVGLPAAAALGCAARPGAVSYGLEASYPQWVSASAKAGWRTSSQHTFVLEARPGITAGEMNAGFARGHVCPVIANFYKLSVLQTWGDASSVPAGQTYVGFEYEFMLGRLSLCAALYKHVAGGDAEVDPLVSVGIGVELGCRWLKPTPAWSGHLSLDAR